jgi:hypothetical protein
MLRPGRFGQIAIDIAAEVGLPWPPPFQRSKSDDKDRRQDKRA